ncbi:MAG: hypothetical protein C5B50_05165 [Verrucomicrobia bacterium]|nr:MAG: hypothetical protein C5B50_05165 [Verrucomicrobiota bacterium]
MFGNARKLKADAGLRERRFKRLLWRTAIVPLVFMLGASFLLAKLVGTLLGHAQWVDHTDQVIARARACEQSGLLMERSLGAFEAGAPDYAGMFGVRSNQITAELRELSELVSDNPAQQGKVKEIASHFAGWAAAAQLLLVRIRAKENVPPAELQVERTSFDQFLGGFDSFVRTEEALREQRTRNLTRLDQRIRSWRTLLLVSTGGLFSLLLAHELKGLADMYRLSEAAVEQRAELFQTTLASIGDAVIATDDQGKVTFMNRVAEQLTGWASDEARDARLRDVLDVRNEDNGQPVADPVSQVLASGQSVGLAGHSVLQSKSGKKIPVANSGSPIREKSGKTCGVVVVFRDATNERAAQRTQGRLAAIVKWSEDAIISKDLSGTITAWNRGAERLFGYKESEALGKSITMLIPPERTHEEDRLLSAIRRGERLEHYETVRVAKDGHRLDVSVSLSPIYDEHGKVIGASKIARDIGKLKADADALRKARDELELRVAERTQALTTANEKLMQADRFKSDFLAAMSHELRTPLNSIIGFSEIIKTGRAGPVTAKQAEYMGMALSSARHLLNLINDLLDLSRIEAGKDEVFLEPFELAPVIEEAVGNVQTVAHSKGLNLESHTRAAMVYSDRKKVYQVILNLLNNAVKFTDRGKVRIEAVANNGQLTITVEDTGIGMTSEQKDSLFQAFRRASQPARRIYEGTGLGLYLCKKIVTLLGGDIWAESRPGQGSRFSFKIPVRSGKW